MTPLVPLPAIALPQACVVSNSSTMNGHAASHYPPSPYGSPYPEEEETYELTPPQNSRYPNSFDFQFQDSAPSPRPIMPIRPGHTATTSTTNYSPPEYSSPWLQPTPRLSGGPDSFPNTPYDSRSASPTLVCVAFLRSTFFSFFLLVLPCGSRDLQCRTREKKKKASRQRQSGSQ